MKWVRLLLLVTACSGVFCLVAFRRGWIAPQPPVLAALAFLVGILALVEGLSRLRACLVQRGRRISALLRLAVAVGLLLVCGGGIANWLFSLQGAVILTEKEVVPLAVTQHLQAFEAGPLSDIDEMHLGLELGELELLADAAGTFTPVSALQIYRAGKPAEMIQVRPRRGAAFEALRFQQGAFGYAPRIVILRGPETLFDKVVPFLTERQGEKGLTFQGDFTLEKENLDVTATVSLEDLDERMKGHPKLLLTVRRADEVLGSGELTPGHFADLKDGYRIGFAGLKKWSEIDISRKNYPIPIILGFGMMVLGGLLWPFAAWRKW